MNPRFSSENLTEALARSQKHWMERQENVPAPETSVPKAFTIAVSREAGTYGAAIARDVATRLGWPLYDRELLQRIAEDMGVHHTLLESIDERQKNWLSECLASFSSAPKVSEFAYFRKLVETLLSLASHGECVIVGRGATVVLPQVTTLRVRVVAPLQNRIQAVQREHSISINEATMRVETTDQERNRFITNHFSTDPGNPANYDLVLNAARFSIKECADLVIAALSHLHTRPPMSLPQQSSKAALG